MVLVSLLLAAVALAAAGLATWTAWKARSELARLSRGLDAALAALDARTKAADAERLLLEERLRTEIDTVALRGASAAAPALAADVIPHPVMAGRRRLPKTDPADATEIALARILDDGELELSLEPIVSVSRNAGVAFDVHACLEIDGRTLHIHRLSSATRHVRRNAFEKALVLRAAEIARRRLGSKGDRLPLHCPVSEELLLNPKDCAEIAALVTINPALADQLVLSVPAPLLAASTGAVAAGIDTLASCGLGFAAEGWDKPAEGIRMLRDRGTVALKADADRLLDRLKIRRGAAMGAELVAMARAEGLALVARGIRSDEDAVELLDLGIDLMVGPRFAEPKRLRPGPANTPGAMADAQAG
ncbi:EAL domain-containing protein [Aquibium microcysteis]|uniref:EAL domain-containing protein n=1 Tax=Aquibium microcysteis TaxID=675281 RepID=UPI00165D263C|nr:EAL domain-containing protein [Aquibium microcysteis]